MKVNFLFASFLAALVVCGCSRAFPDHAILDIPTGLDPGTATPFSIETGYAVAFTEVRRTLPEAGFRGIVFDGDCSGLAALQGEVLYDFLEVDPALLRPHAYTAGARIDTQHGLLDIHFRDVTDYYPNTELMDIPTDIEIRADFKLAADTIQGLHIEPCDVTVTQIQEGWHVRCGARETFIQECAFQVINHVVRPVPTEMVPDAVFPPQ